MCVCVCVFIVSPWTLGATASDATLIGGKQTRNGLKDMFLRLALELSGREVIGSSSLFEVRTLELSLKQTENALSRLGRETASCKGLESGGCPGVRQEVCSALRNLDYHD